MSNRLNISSGAIWEDQVGYSRAVRIRNTVEVSGSTSVEGDKILHPGDPYHQTIATLETIQKALDQAGAKLVDVIRTRIYVTDIEQDWEAIGKAHGSFYSDIKPTTTMIEVSRLIHPDMLVEIEASAIISE